MTEVIDKLTQAKTRLSLTEPFFSTILYRFPTQATDLVPIAAVTPRGLILYNPKAIENLTVEEIVFLLCHEVMHIALAHSLRRDNRDHHIFNIACDAIINETLIALGIGQFIENGIRMPGAENRTAEGIYDELISQATIIRVPLDIIFSGDRSKGIAGRNGARDDCLAEARAIYGEDLDEASIREIRNQIKLAVAEGITKEKMSKKIGTLRGHFLERIEACVLTEKLPWYTLLSRYMNKFVTQNQSWCRPNKRFSNLYLPSTDKEAHMGKLIVGLDTSGSIDSHTLSVFGKHLFDVIEECKPEEVIVLWCDTEVQKAERHNWQEVPFTLEAHGRGGTDMTAIHKWVKDNEDVTEVDACVILTDGLTPYPTKGQEDVPTLWVLTTESKLTPKHINYIVLDKDQA